LNLPQDDRWSSSWAAGTRAEQLVAHLDKKMSARVLVEEKKVVVRALKAGTREPG
jgi:hypothetical protein